MWIILITAIILVSVFVYSVKGERYVTGVIVFRDIPLTKENYANMGTETFSNTFYLPGDSCSGFVTYCGYVYKSGVDSRADINKDGKIDDTDLAIMVKAYGCNKTRDNCWDQPIEECFFTISGRRFKDPTRDCKMTQADSDLITNYYGQTHSYALSYNCDEYEICRADINQDGKVDIYDATIAGTKIGQTADLFVRLVQHKSEADLDGNGAVNLFDAIIVTTNYGKDAIERVCRKTSISHNTGREYGISVQGIGISWVHISYDCLVQ